MPSTDAPAADLRALQEAIGHQFADPDLLEQALTHPSVAGLGPAERHLGRAYERLEFLGDRVLALVIAQTLLDRHPDEREGDLAKRLAALVQRDALAELAVTIDLGRHLRLSPGEDETGGRTNAAILADAVEALIGAVFKDAGLDAARDVITRLWADALTGAREPPQDPKTRLQEWAQQRRRPMPVYETLRRSGPPHDPLFEVRVIVQGLDPAVAGGKSKRAAEKAAAQLMLARLDGRGDV